MSWDCPFNRNNFCCKRDKVCVVLSPGCVLKGKVKFIGDEKRVDQKTIPNHTTYIDIC